MTQGKVLVLGDDTRSFLAIVRSLGRQRIEVHAAPVDFTSPALASRYIARLHYLPFWTAGRTAWFDAMNALLRAERYDLVIPCDELTLLPLQQHRVYFSTLTRLAIPNDRSIETLFDKHKTRELARSVGAHVAAGDLALPTDSGTEMLVRFGTPLVLKPRRSYALDSLELRGRVRVCTSSAMLDELLPAIRPGDFIYEAFFPGRGAGVSLLASRGKVLQAFEHHRVRENASGSYYRVSAPLTPALEACCAAMAAALEYTGITMFEFRLGEVPGEWILLEVNARPWGSMPLPVSLGVDFPYRWYKLLVEGSTTPPVAYKTGVYGRNLVLDVRDTLSELKKARLEHTGIVRLAASRLAEMGRIAIGQEHYDALVSDDLRPGLDEMRTAGVQGAKRLARAGNLARLMPGRSQRHSWAALERIVQTTGPGPVALVFVCQGNICRSPFAAAMLREQAGDRGNRLRITSAGMLPRPGRPTPAAGIEAAAAFGIDLTTHQSTHLSKEEAEGAAVLIIFDEINRNAISRRYPGLQIPILKLGHFAPPGADNDISDPINGDLTLYAKTYNRIASATAGLLRVLAKRAD